MLSVIFTGKKLTLKLIYYLSLIISNNKSINERNNKPGNKKWLIQVIKHVDNEIIISHTNNIWTWKLLIDKNSLHFYSQINPSKL